MRHEHVLCARISEDQRSENDNHGSVPALETAQTVGTNKSVALGKIKTAALREGATVTICGVTH